MPLRHKARQHILHHPRQHLLPLRLRRGNPIQARRQPGQVHQSRGPPRLHALFQLPRGRRGRVPRRPVPADKPLQVRHLLAWRVSRRASPKQGRNRQTKIRLHLHPQQQKTRTLLQNPKAQRAQPALPDLPHHNSRKVQQRALAGHYQDHQEHDQLLRPGPADDLRDFPAEPISPEGEEPEADFAVLQEQLKAAKARFGVDGYFGHLYIEHDPALLQEHPAPRAGLHLHHGQGAARHLPRQHVAAPADAEFAGVQNAAEEEHQRRDPGEGEALDD